MKIFSGSSNKDLARKVAQELNSKLCPLEIFVFPDGERRIQIQDKVLDEDTVVIQSTNYPVDTHYLELFFIMDGLKRSGASSITVVMPYMGYQRQDHIFRDGEAVSLDVIVIILEAMKIDKLITFDPHTIKLPQFFKNYVSDLSALPLFAQEIKKRGWDDKSAFVLVSPDMGGLRRIKQMSELLGGMSWIATVKDRALDTGDVVINHFEGPLLPSDLKGKTALMVDDMVSSGKTLIEAVKLLKSRGVLRTIVFITHPIFSAEAPLLLENSEADLVFVTDSVWIPDYKRFKKLEILTISGMIAKELQ